MLRPGHYVVLHEFAHKLDGLDGVTNGMPPLRRGMDRQAWAESLGGAYDRLCLQVEKEKRHTSIHMRRPARQSSLR